MTAWLLLFLPLLVAAANQLFLKRSATIASYLSVLSAAVTFGLALFFLNGSPTSPTPLTWIAVGDFKIEIGITLDQLSTGMMVVVTGIGLLVHIFSLAYMADDDAKARFFTCLSLFMFSMTGIVLSSNFIMTFIFWELVGVSSYLLIGHWFLRASDADAAKKAFIVNRIGDFGFMIGILMLWGITGHLDFAGMSAWANNHGLESVPGGITGGVFVATILCTFCGAVGKSAQMPLHVWLPDAMEGPTPVSALIHAATMVAAGVYMLVRLQFSFGGFELGATIFHNDAGTVISWIGGITSLCAALMATQQNDIKRILAYSTLSQLGYMIMVVGLGHGEAGMFHLFTHAWFKALLFLGSGAIIYACHHEQDIWKMGGLLRKMPITGITFLIGTAALMAVPFVTSGFYSKEEILGAAYEENQALFWIAVFVAFLTTFYMTRAFVVTFLGKPRSENADHAHEVGPLMMAPLVLLAVMALFSGWGVLSGTLHATRPELHGEHPTIILAASVGTLVLGLLLGGGIYWGKQRDPISIPLFRERFKIDWIYDNIIVRYCQDALAAIINFFDEFFINGILVGGSTRLAESFGGVFRRVQSGNLQGYAFVFGLGVLAVIYFTTF